MKRLLHFIFVAVLMPLTLFAQQSIQPFYFYNADDILIRQKIAQDSTLLGKYIIYENNLKQVIESMNNGNKGAKTDTLINGRRIVPVVFHVIHKGGPENISRAQTAEAKPRSGRA